MNRLRQEDFKAKIVKEIGKNSKGHYQAIFACTTCGTEFVKYVSSYRHNQLNGECRTCSSITRAEKLKTHGDSLNTSKYNRLYTIYRGMRQRCCNTNSNSYINYGARGITICKDWLESYTTFKNWAINNGYSNTLTIDRIDPYGDYKPSNCRWVTQTIQSRNTRKIHSTNKSGYRGVSWNSGFSKWEVSISIDSKTVKIGYYNDRLTAAKAYDTYVLNNNLEHTLNGLINDSADKVDSNVGKLLISTNVSGYIGVNSPTRLAKYKNAHSSSVEYKGKKVFSGNFESTEMAAFFRDKFLRETELPSRAKKNFTDKQFLQLQEKYLLR